MCEDGNKIILSKELQKQMIEFFLKTSIPRKKKEEQEKIRVLSEKQKQETDRSKENGNDENGDLC